MASRVPDAGPVATLAGPALLVVVTDRASANRLPAGAAQARRAGARLLIALARPRPGFTTDAAIARYVAVRARDELLRLESVTHEMLRGRGIDYDIVPMTYRGSRSAAKQERRIADQTNHLARRHNATSLPEPEMRAAAQPSRPRRAPSGWSGVAG